MNFRNSKHHLTFRIGHLSLIPLLFFLLPTPIFAQSTPANTVTVSPSIVHLDLQTDSPETTLYYKNNGDETISLSFNASDVTELEDGYKLSFLEPKNAQN